MIENVASKMVSVDYRKEVPVNEKVDLSDMPKVKQSNDDITVKLGISPVGKDLFNAIWKTEDFFDSFSIFSNTKDLDTKVAKDYEQRYNKIKELVAENPELKGKEKEFVKKLDERYGSMLEHHSSIFTMQYKGVTDLTNLAAKHISDIYGEEFKEKEYLDDGTKKEIEADFVNVFKHITDKIKEGASVEDIKNISLSTNKHLKSFSDIRAVSKQASLVQDFAFDVQRKAMNYALVGNISKEEMFSDLSSMIDNVNSKFDEFKTQKFGNQYIKNIFNFDKIMLSIKNSF